MIAEYAPVVALPLLAYFLFWFGFSMYKKRIDLVDIAWGGGFIVLVSSLLFKNQDQVSYALFITALLVFVWGFRLSHHILMRNWSKKEDARYTQMRATWRGPVWLNALVRVFLLQAVLVVTVAAGRIDIAVPQTSESIYFSSGTAEQVVPVESAWFLPILCIGVAVLFVSIAQRLARPRGAF